MPKHVHRWDYRNGVNRTGRFRCSGCRAVVSLVASPLADGVSFTLAVVVAGCGVSSADLATIGDWCIETVDRASVFYVKRPQRRRKRVA